MRLLALLLLPLCVLRIEAIAAEGYERQRQAMVTAVREMGRAVGEPRAAISEAVLDALGRVPRHLFVPEALRSIAYENRPLPIGSDQTISQPYIVALMTRLVEPKPGVRILEVGTGSGYQAAVLAEMGAEVYTIEIVPELGKAAAATLMSAGYGNVHTRIGDGYAGWPEAAPFDGILVTAAPDHVPQPLIDQLKPGGRMVIPVGADGGDQTLQLLQKESDGKLSTRDILPVIFVPLTGKR